MYPWLIPKPKFTEKEKNEACLFKKRGTFIYKLENTVRAVSYF
jgi:hypothetical protein